MKALVKKNQIIADLKTIKDQTIITDSGIIEEKELITLEKRITKDEIENVLIDMMI